MIASMDAGAACPFMPSRIFFRDGIAQILPGDLDSAAVISGQPTQRALPALHLQIRGGLCGILGSAHHSHLGGDDGKSLPLETGRSPLKRGEHRENSPPTGEGAAGEPRVDRPRAGTVKAKEERQGGSSAAFGEFPPLECQVVFLGALERSGSGGRPSSSSDLGRDNHCENARVQNKTALGGIVGRSNRGF
eukprot:scaffold245795_cov27-Tisochrysis_lutea.AAC.4